MLGNFQDQPGATVADFEGIKNRWELVLKLDIHNGTNDCNNFAICNSCFGCSSIQVFGSVEAP